MARITHHPARASKMVNAPTIIDTTRSDFHISDSKTSRIMKPPIIAAIAKLMRPILSLAALPLASILHCILTPLPILTIYRHTNFQFHITYFDP